MERSVDFFSEFGCILGGLNQGIRHEICLRRNVSSNISSSP